VRTGARACEFAEHGAEDEIALAAVVFRIEDRRRRFVAHDREHTIQLRKTLQALGFAPTEPQLLLADAQAALGALEITLRNLGDAYLDQEPPGGGPTIAQLVEEMLEDERGI